MKKMTKKMIALFMTVLMVAAILPITASAMQYARIVVELKEPYYGENLAEILPEIEIEAAYPFIEGYAFTVYYDAESDEDGRAAAEKLETNPLVRSATYCVDDASEASAVVYFKVHLNNEYYGENFYMSVAELEKIFPEMDIKTVKEKGGRYNYHIFCNVNSIEEASELELAVRNNPFISSSFCYLGNYGEYITTGLVRVTTKNKCTEEEFMELISDVGASVYNSYEGFRYFLVLNDITLKGTLEAVEKLEKNSAIVRVEYRDELIESMEMPVLVEESRYRAPEKPEVTVETALAALRITAGLSEVKNGVYDYRLADAIWQYDCDGDKVITVTDALSLLRIAAGIKA